MSHDLAAAVCLMLVMEGLVLFAAPRGWQATMREAAKLRLRLFGAAAIGIGLVTLQLMH
jgi:uncharacterized protein YjeT (DUF2065 family)